MFGVVGKKNRMQYNAKKVSTQTQTPTHTCISPTSIIQLWSANGRETDRVVYLLVNKNRNAKQVSQISCKSFDPEQILHHLFFHLVSSASSAAYQATMPCADAPEIYRKIRHSRSFSSHFQMYGQVKQTVKPGRKVSMKSSLIQNSCWTKNQEEEPKA